MKRILTLIIAFASLLTACAQNKEKTMKDNKKALVAYFSRVDENYNVGYITKGNTEIVAEMIASETSSDLFHIETVNTYPKEYTPCIEVAKKELNDNARPVIKGDIKVEDYDIIYLGYPNWWGEPPMAVFTFIEKHDWRGKTVVPFCTHEGSGLGSTEQSLKTACKGATFEKGFAIRGTTVQQSRDEAHKAVTTWLGK